jgi:hypothetical protein
MKGPPRVDRILAILALIGVLGGQPAVGQNAGQFPLALTGQEAVQIYMPPQDNDNPNTATAATVFTTTAQIAGLAMGGGGGIGSAVPPYVGFWTDVDNNPNISVGRFRERLLIGNCVGMPSTRSNTNNTWIPNTAAGANWIPRDSELCVMSDNGSIALSGMTRTSDGQNYVVSPIAGAFFTINDTTAASRRAGWGLYVEMQHQPSGAGVTAGSYGMEMDIKNASTLNVVPDPYAEAGEGIGGAYGLRLLAGGDNSYGPHAVNNSAAAVVITRNAKSWNSGIIFSRYAFGLAGDGSVQHAIDMATNHQISWWRGPSIGYTGLEHMTSWIRSDITTPGGDMGMVFTDHTVSFNTADPDHNAFYISHSVGGVNAVIVFSALTGENPLIRPSIQGDANVSIDIRGIGSGGVLVGPAGVGSDESIRAFAVYNGDRTKPSLNVDTTPTVPVISTGQGAFQVGNAVDSGGASAPLNLALAELGIRIKNSPSNTAPGALGIKLTAVCGTNAGTAKIIAYGGTSATPSTVVDNIGAGVTGC